jgi:hypothetical protein
MGQLPGPAETTSGCIGQVYPAGAELAREAECGAVATAAVDASVEACADAGVD